MNIFFIGSSSNFANNVICKLEEENTVYRFGRENLNYTNYTDMQKVFKEYPKPDVVIFNIKCCGTTIDYTKTIEKDELDDLNDNFYTSFYTKLHIYDLCKEAEQFVFITSSITKWSHDPELGFNNIMYRHLRASEQQIMKAIASEGKLAYGLCPGGMDSNPELYAENLAKIVLEKDNNLKGTVSLVNEYYE